jgi:hypothetical protein
MWLFVVPFYLWKFIHDFIRLLIFHIAVKDPLYLVNE